MEITDYEFLYDKQLEITLEYKGLVEDYKKILEKKNELIKVLQEYIDESKF